MLGFPIADYDKTYDFLRKAARDKESKESFRFPVEYMFKGVPYDFGKGADPLEATLAEMDKWGIERAMIGIGWRHQPARPARSTRSASSPAPRSTPTRAWTRCATWRRPTTSTASAR